MTKKPSPRNKEWEKDRRDRLNQTFNELSKLLPQTDGDKSAALSKIEILQKSIALILELQKELKELQSGTAGEDSTTIGTRTAVLCQQPEPVATNLNDPLPMNTIEEQKISASKKDKPKRKYTRRAKQESAKTVDHIVKDVASEMSKIGPSGKENKRPRRVPIHVKKQGRKTKVLLKSELYAKIQRHVLKCWREKHKKVRKANRDIREVSQTRRTIDILSHSDDQQRVPQPEKPLEEISDLNPMTNADLSADLFVSLQVPQIASQSGCLSPTEAFLLSFPVVSSGGKAIEQTSEQLTSNNSLEITPLGSIFPVRDEFPTCRSDNRVKSDTSDSNQKDKSSSSSLLLSTKPTTTTFNNSIYSILPPQKSLEGMTPFHCNTVVPLPAPTPLLFDPQFDITEKLPSFTFSLTTTTTTATTGNGQNNVHHEKTDCSSSRTNAPRLNYNIVNSSVGGPLHMSSSSNKTTFAPAVEHVSSLSTDTKTTWSYQNKKLNLFDGVIAVGTPNADPPLQATSADYDNAVVPFTFSLTSKTTTSSNAGGGSYESRGMPMNGSKCPSVMNQMGGTVFSGTSSAAAPSCSSIFDSYTATAPFNSFTNSFLAPPPPPPCSSQFVSEGASSSQYGVGSTTTNGFSFQLTSPNHTQSTYTPIASSQNAALNPFAIPSTKQPVATAAPSSINVKRSHKSSVDPPSSLTTKREKSHRKSSNVGLPTEKKSTRSAEGTVNKAAHVNWMTDSMRNYSTEDHHHQYPVINQPSCNSYLPSPVVTSSGMNVAQGGSSMFREDFNQKSDIFFAHPPGEDRFFWNQTLESDRSQRHSDFNVPQLLPLPPPPPAPYATAVVAPPPSHSAEVTPFGSSSSTVGAASHSSHQHNNNNKTIQSSGNYHSNGNYFSVSNLVAPNRKYADSGDVPQGANTSSRNKWKTSSAAWDVNYNNKNDQHISNISSPMKSASSKNYSAEALIGSTTTTTHHHHPHHHPGMSSTGTNDHLKFQSNKRHCLPHSSLMFPMQDGSIPIVGDLPEPPEALPLDFNFSTSGSQFGHPRTELKIHQSSQEATNPFSLFSSNDYIQPPPPPPLFSAPALSLLTDTLPSMGSSIGSRGKAKQSSTGHRKKSQFDAGGGSMLLQPNDGMSIGQPNYDLSGSSSLFTTPQPPPHTPFLINPCSDSFSYSDNCKLSQPFVGAPHPPPPIDFNTGAPSAPSSSGTSNYSSNYLTNFNLSSICPEINNSIH